jgi:hypothetical protein
MSKFIVHVPKYDTDGISVKLPKNLEIEVSDDITNIDEIEEILSDEISNITGYCHYGFTYKPILTNK